MKKQSLRRRSASAAPIPVRHQLEHEVPTVIHHPEEKMTALARLTHRVILDPGKYATWALGILVVVLAIVVASNWTSSSSNTSTLVWSKLDSATKPEDLTETAKAYPGTIASRWALIRAANEYYITAMGDLPNNRDVAVSNLRKRARPLRAGRKRSPRGFVRGPRRLARQGPLPGSEKRARQGDRTVRARGQELAEFSRSRAGQEARRGAQEAGSSGFLQRALCVFAAQGHAAATRHREVRFPAGNMAVCR